MSGWIPIDELLPNLQDGEILITDGKFRLIGQWRPCLGRAGGPGSFGGVLFFRGRKSITLVDGVTHWQRLPALPIAAVPVEWPASRGTEHGELMRLQVEAENDPNAVQ